MSNMVNVCRCSRHSLSFSFSDKQILILSNIDLLILPISFLAGFIDLVVGWLTKFSLWPFKVIKQLFVPLTFILSNISARFEYFMPSLLITSSILFVSKYQPKFSFLCKTYLVNCTHALIKRLHLKVKIFETKVFFFFADAVAHLHIFFGNSFCKFYFFIKVLQNLVSK